MSKTQDITGQTFGKLTAIRLFDTTAKGAARWLFRCACGGEKVAAAGEVKRGRTASCGCLALAQKRAAGMSRQHEFSRANMTGERKSWENMLARCYDKSHVSYANYGAVGIAVSDEWRTSFEAFARAMGPRPADTTIDRIDGTRGYEPGNCRWATRIEQANNRRTNHLVCIDGQTKTVAEWARCRGVAPHIIHSRLYQGWTDHDAVMLPVGPRKPKGN